MTLLLLAGPAWAATWTVGTSGSATHPTIGAALAAARDGDTVVVEPGTYAESLDFGGKELTLRSRDGAATTVIDPGGAAWIAVYLGAGEGPDAVLEGFTIRNAGQRGVWVWGASPTLRDLVIEGTGSAETWGGALVLAYGTPALEDVTLRDNQAYAGAHAYLEGATATFTRCTLTGGSAAYGGAVMGYGYAATFEDSVIDSNTASSNGAGVYLGWGSALTLTGTSLRGNVTAGGHGAGIYAEGGSAITLTGGDLSDNLITDWDLTGAAGGGLYSNGYSQVTLDGTLVSGNQAYIGGGLYLAAGDVLAISGATFSANTGYYGGGAYVGSGSVIDTGSTWDSNSITYSGGALYLSYSPATLAGSAFTENSAVYGYGAGVYAYGSALDIADTTFRDNFTYYYGGGVFSEVAYAPLACARCTFEDNEAVYGTGGGIYASWYTSVQLSESTFHANTAALGGAVYAYAADVSATGSTFTANQATGAAGGALHVQTYHSSLGRVTLDHSTFEGNAAAVQGGAIYGQYVPALTIADSRFVANEVGAGGFGGALIHQYPLGPTTVSRTLFALNQAEYGGAAYLDGGSAGTWSNVTFVENDAGTGGAACLVDTAGQVWTNNGFLGNAAVDDAGALCLVGAGIDFRNNMVAWTREGAALAGWDGEAALPQTFGHNAWYANVEGDAAGTLGNLAAAPGSLATDPALVDYSLDGDPDDDVLVLRRDSPLVDAGDPAILDPDGSVSDIGPWGGPGVEVEDADGDGWDSWLDCDDADPAVHPGAAETWYDGVDADCAGASDFDQDGDGLDADGYGGADCDDRDPAVSDCAGEDTGGPGEDPGPKPGSATEAGCGCATGGPGAMGWALLVAALAGGRRARGSGPGT